jgi:putative SOS response-associated peptidase YedK
MCGRYSIAIEKEDLEKVFGVQISEPFMKRYNAAPSQELPVILNTSPDTLSSVSWGLSPAWMYKMKNFRGLINVRTETLRDRRTFRQDLLERRCLIPADGFYEWKKHPSGRKIPYRFTMQKGAPFALAGIWQEQGGGNAAPGFAILTTVANGVVSPIHHRMPVMLRPDQKSAWLSPTLGYQEFLGMLRPIKDEAIRAYEVSSLVNRASEETPEVIEPVKG